ncbi:MAG: hypothetical protein ACT4PT_02115 [Methanobacteriota archaeon]
MPRAAVRFDLDPHWFRRATHAAAAGLVVYYLLPDRPWAEFLRGWGVLLILLGASTLELLRVRGVVSSETLFALRDYERGRVSGYLYFGIAAGLLLVFFPQSIAVPSLVGLAIGDPLMGEIRRHGRRTAALLAGGAFVAALFVLAGWTPGWAIVAGGLAAIGESAKSKFLDDDFLMPMLPATTLWLLAATGLLGDASPRIPPDLLSPWGR